MFAPMMLTSMTVTRIKSDILIPLDEEKMIDDVLQYKDENQSIKTIYIHK